MIRRWVIALAAAVFLVAACSSSKSTDSQGGAAGPATTPTVSVVASTRAAAKLSSDDPCAVVSAADVTTAYGGQAGAGATDPTLPGRCTWKVSGSPQGDGRVSLYFASVQSRSAFDSAKSGLPGVVSVDGVGDAAFYSPTTGALEVATGDTVFTTQGTFGSTPSDAVKAADVALATAALAH